MNKNTSKNASTQLIRDAAGMTSAKMDQARGNWIMQHADNFQVKHNFAPREVKLQETTLIHTHTLSILYFITKDTSMWTREARDRTNNLLIDRIDDLLSPLSNPYKAQVKEFL